MPEDTKRHALEELAKALTAKQRQFVDTYLLNGLNGPAAAQAVGYRNPAESRRTLANTKVAAYVRACLNEAGFTPEEIKRRLEYFATGDMQDFLTIAPSERSYWIRAEEHEELVEQAKRRGIAVGAFDNYDIAGILGGQNVAQTEDGVMMVCVRTVEAEVTIDWRRAERAHALGRVKKIKLQKDGSVEFELHDPVKSLELLGKAHKMFTDKVEHSGEVGVIGIRVTPPAGGGIVTVASDLLSMTPERELDFQPHLGQWRAWNSWKRHVLVLAGTQSGKTSFGPMWLYREIQRCGPGDYLVVAPAFPLLELKLRPEFMRLFDRQLRLGSYSGSPTKKFTFSEAGSKRTFGARHNPDIPTQVFFGHAQDPDSLESATIKAAWLDEAGQKKFKKASHDAIMRRLAIHRGRALYTTTPYYIGWLKRELHDQAGKPGSDVELINFRSVDNPMFSREEYEERKAKMPSWKFAMFYDGIFTRPAGLIYDVFDAELDAVERFPIPEDWPRVFGLDFGAVNTCCLKWAYDASEDIWYVYSEYLAGGRTAKEHVAQLLAGEPKGKVRAVGGAASEQNWRDEFTAAGLPVQKPSVSEVEVGIDRLYSLIKTRKVKFFADLEGVLGGDETDGEIETYSRVLDEAGEPTDEIEDKNRYHRLDAGRYAATLIVQTPGPRPPTAPRQRGYSGYST